MKLVFASHNQNKVNEIKSLLPKTFDLVSLTDIGFLEEIPEIGLTLDENSQIKARTIYEKTGFFCFADDTGLEVDCLQGAPGILSARYAGKDATMAANKQLLLSQIGAAPEPTARFRCMLCYFDGIHPPTYAEDTLEGIIRPQQQGGAGFGYDDLFEVQGHGQTLAQLKEGTFTKTHRFKAFQKLLTTLQQ
jgi:XTP/dITP diphosphohydrolase